VTCGICKGAGNLVAMNDHRLAWWKCPQCLGAGVTAMSGPATLRCHAKDIVYGTPK